MTQTFTYSQYTSDFITEILKQYGDDMPDDLRQVLNSYVAVEQNRDDDIENYLSESTYVPALGVVRSVAENFADATLTAMSFEGIDFQSTNLFDWVATAASRVTLEEQGIVQINANIYYAGSAVGDYRTAQIYLNGVTELAAQTNGIIGGNPCRVSVSVLKSLEAGDYIQLFGNQNSGGNLGVTGTLSLSYLGLAG